MTFNFQIAPTITKELLLEKFSEETYMEYYLGIPVKKGLFRNPLRKDNNPTASFYRNRQGELIFKDFGWDFYGNFIDVVMYQHNCTYHEAMRQIAIDFNIIEGNSNTSTFIRESPRKFSDRGPSKIQIQEQSFSKQELDWWLGFGITPKTLKKYNVHSCKSVFLNDKLFAQSSTHNPIFGYYMGSEKNMELWRIYFPKRKSFRFISNTSSKKVQGYYQLPKEGKVLVITKSMKDVMVLHTLGIPAIAPNSENLFIDDEVLESLKERFHYIIVFYDNDLAGVRNMRKIRKEHPELHYIWLPRKYGSKDISDFHRDHGRRKTLELLKQYLTWLSKI